MRPILLVDARNLMYRAIFANKKGGRQNYHHFTVMMRFLWEWLDKFQPSSVNIFWDARKSTLWRRKLLAEYKARDEREYTIDIKDDLILTQAAAKAIFAHMGVRQFTKVGEEADDLIYSACRVLSPRPLVICSSDADYTQILFRMSNVQQYDALKSKFIDRPDFDTAIQKAFWGDHSDRLVRFAG